MELFPTLLPGQQLGVREPAVAGHAQGRHETAQEPDRVVVEPEPEESLGQAEHLGGADRRVGEAEREPDCFVAFAGLAQKVPVRRVLKRLVAVQVAQAGQADIVDGEVPTDVRCQEEQPERLLTQRQRAGTLGVFEHPASCGSRRAAPDRLCRGIV